jgi:orotate phosphoribosyltransferase
VSYPKTRNVVEKALANLVKQKFPKVKAIIGTATAGIAHAAYVSEILKLPMAYVRAKTKDHGRAKHIEGEIDKKLPIVVIEDLISTGNSSLEVIKILRKEKYNVLGLISIFTYNTKKATINFENEEIKYFSLTTLDDLLDVALAKKEINEKQK